MITAGSGNGSGSSMLDPGSESLPYSGRQSVRLTWWQAAVCLSQLLHNSLIILHNRQSVIAILQALCNVVSLYRSHISN